jgi:hypothetical protein
MADSERTVVVRIYEADSRRVEKMQVWITKQDGKAHTFAEAFREMCLIAEGEKEAPTVEERT